MTRFPSHRPPQRTDFGDMDDVAEAPPGDGDADSGATDTASAGAERSEQAKAADGLDPEVAARLRSLRGEGGAAQRDASLEGAMEDPEVAKYVALAMRLPERPKGGSGGTGRGASSAGSSAAAAPVPAKTAAHERWYVHRQRRRGLRSRRYTASGKERERERKLWG